MNRTPRIKPFAEKLILAFSQHAPGEEDKLSMAHSFILIERDVMGCSYEQLAEKTGESLGTVKSRLSRARIHLNLLRARAVHPNGKPKFAEDGTLLDEQGNRSIFDDVDE